MKIPDLKSNSADRYILSLQLQKYMSSMNTKFPQIDNNLRTLRLALATNTDCLC